MKYRAGAVNVIFPFFLSIELLPATYPSAFSFMAFQGNSIGLVTIIGAGDSTVAGN
jgi:hypothetical protein